MFNENDILTRLQNGETPDAIANDITAALNKAIAMKQEADAKAAEQARQAEIQKQKEETKLQQIADLEGIFNDLLVWRETYYPSEPWDEAFAELKAADIVELIDSLSTMTLALNDLGIKKVPVAKKTAIPVKPVNNTNPDAVINQFLKDMGLK